MIPEKRLSFTPLPSAHCSLKNSTTLTKLESYEDPLYLSQPSGDKFETDNQHLPPCRSTLSAGGIQAQKHWWTPQEDQKLQQLI
jgi:hypothetical protein